MRRVKKFECKNLPAFQVGKMYFHFNLRVLQWNQKFFSLNNIPSKSMSLKTFVLVVKFLLLWKRTVARESAVGIVIGLDFPPYISALEIYLFFFFSNSSLSEKLWKRFVNTKLIIWNVGISISLSWARDKRRNSKSL